MRVSIVSKGCVSNATRLRFPQISLVLRENQFPRFCHRYEHAGTTYTRRTVESTTLYGRRGEIKSAAEWIRVAAIGVAVFCSFSFPMKFYYTLSFELPPTKVEKFFISTSITSVGESLTFLVAQEYLVIPASCFSPLFLFFSLLHPRSFCATTSMGKVTGAVIRFESDSSNRIGTSRKMEPNFTGPSIVS